MTDDLNEMLQVGDQNVSLADLAGIGTDEIEETRGSTFPGGVFPFKCDKAELSVVSGDKGKHAVVVLGFVCTAPGNFADPKEASDSVAGERHEERVFIAGGDLTQQDTVTRIGYIKTFMRDCGYKGGGSLQDLLSGFVGHELIAKTWKKPGKNDPDVAYTNMKIGWGFWKAGPKPEAQQQTAAA